MKKEKQRVVVVVCVLLDLFAVSLIVPLLPVRLRELGISQAKNGLLSSIYSGAQILGGLVLGFLSDRDIIGRRGLLLISFFGAAAAYTIVGSPSAGLYALAGSRILVGLCKQTMTASTAILSELTEHGTERTLWIGRQSSAAQMSWIAGQSIGGFLYAQGDPRLPASVAVSAYAVCSFLIVSSLPPMVAGAASMKKNSNLRPPKSKKGLKALATSPVVLSVATARLVSQFVTIAANNGRALYELDRWHLTRSDVAYLNSFKSAVSVLASWRSDLFVRYTFGSSSTKSQTSFFWPLIISVTSIVALTAFIEALPGTSWYYLFSFFGIRYQKTYLHSSSDDIKTISLTQKAIHDPSLLVYALLLFPINVALRQVLSIALRSRFTEVVPRKNTASALAALDVALSAVGVIAPIVGGFLLDASGGDHQSINEYTLARQPLIVATLNALTAFIFVALTFFTNSTENSSKRHSTPDPSADSSVSFETFSSDSKQQVSHVVNLDDGHTADDRKDKQL